MNANQIIEQGVRGVRVRIMRTPGLSDCSNGGVSSRADELTIVGLVDRTGDEGGGPRGNRDVEPLPAHLQVDAVTDDAPAAVIVVQRMTNILGGGLYRNIEPLEGRDKHYMAGGTDVDLSDGRLEDVLGSTRKLTLRDRREW